MAAKLTVESFASQPVQPPCLLVIFGGAGALAQRKLAPALYNLAAERLLPGNFAVLGSARTARSDEQYRQLLCAAVTQNSRRPPEQETLQALLARTFYQRADLASAADVQALGRRMEQLDGQFDLGGGRLIYLSTPPEAYGQIIDVLGRAGLFCWRAGPEGSGPPCRIVIEKPFGTDLASSGRLNRSLAEHFQESRIYRIDHFLGKETVQNLLVFRFSNAIFDPLLDRRSVHDVQITVAETDGAGGRAEYYDAAGALRDMCQNHLLQLLCLIAMEPPVRLEGQDIRDEKVKVLRAVAPLAPEQAADCTVRGQYAAGGGLAGYRQEKGVPPDSQTETFAALRLEVENDRWAGVPFYLRTGKRLARRASEIVVTFRHEAHRLYGPRFCDWRLPNRLIFRIQPQEGISIAFDAKAPGPRDLLRPVRMDFSYERAFEVNSPEAYERLLLDVLRGEHSLFARADEVDLSWKIVDSIRLAWQNIRRPALELYPAASWGPPAQGLFADEETRWQTA